MCGSSRATPTAYDCYTRHSVPSINASTTSQISRAASRSAVRLPGTPVIGSPSLSLSSNASSTVSWRSKVRSDSRSSSARPSGSPVAGRAARRARMPLMHDSVRPPGRRDRGADPAMRRILPPPAAGRPRAPPPPAPAEAPQGAPQDRCRPASRSSRPAGCARSGASDDR